MKKLCAVLILAVILAISPIAFADDVPSEEPKYISVEGTYPDGTTGFVYSDDMLLGDSSTMSGDCVKLLRLYPLPRIMKIRFLLCYAMLDMKATGSITVKEAYMTMIGCHMLLEKRQ